MTTVEILKEMAFTATETQRRALEDAISDLSENKGDLISRQKVLNTLDNMDKTLDEERTVDNYKELVAECIKVLSSDSENPNKCFDGMTNGEVLQAGLQALFPNVSVYEHGSTYSINNEYNFNSTWWNAPYKKGGEE